ncbi:MAG: hypothetical protein D6790_06965, partial [Caldilineae bacterium]
PTPSPTPTPGPDELLDMQIEQLIQEMSVADRVGQLFVVEFPGNRITESSDIAELIQRYRIGGVVISARNRNFSNASPEETPLQLVRLTNQLQGLAYNVTLPRDVALNPLESALEIATSFNRTRLPLPTASVSIPLFIGVKQEGDGLPGSELRNGFTQLPSQMALGATWQPALAEQVGAIVGRELAAVGVNLLLGPNLDILEQPRPDLATGIGVNVFGGDPFWVGKFGQAYIQGVHTGSGDRVAVIAGHFPGQGGSDRRPDEEVATIQKSLDELRRSDLLPFFSVAQRVSSILSTGGDPAMADGFMSAHVRYSSFQGSRERTPPISLATELGMVVALEELMAWRDGGGVLMSDALGVPAVRRYYDPKLETFPVRRTAVEAFLAGNDLLYLARFSLSDSWEDERRNIEDTIAFFRELYTSDPNFAARVDESLHRILRLKRRLYAPEPESHVQKGNAFIPLTEVLVRADALPAQITAGRGQADALVGQVATNALTLLYPDPQGVGGTLPEAPTSQDRIVLFADARPLQECADCPTAPAIPPANLTRIMLSLYGPQGTGLITTTQIISYTFADLGSLLRDELPLDQADAMEQTIAAAQWLIFAMLDVDVEQSEYSDVVKQFLRLRADQVDGRMVVFALNAPYFLDSTEISKLTAYLGVYSKTPPFLNAAVQALFRSIPAPGAPPVSAPGTRFANLVERLEPDPNQRIQLRILNEGVEVTQTEDRAEMSFRVDVSVGDTLQVEAGPILDRNGHVVPDGTPVNFRLLYSGEDLALPARTVETRNGLARISVVLERNGVLNISATSVDATVSSLIQASIGEEQTVVGISEPPTSEPIGVLPPPTAQPEPTQPAPEPTPLPLAEAPQPPNPQARVTFLTLIVALITQLVVLALLLIVLVRVMPRSMLVYRLLWAEIIGWSAYILYGLGLVPGGSWLQRFLYPWGVAPVVVIGMLVPLVWLQLRSE